MKFTIVASLAALITACVSQSIDIGSPANGTSVTPGSTLVVEVDQGDSLTGSVEIAVVIGILSCPGSSCLPAGEALGTILVNGPFNPQFHSSTPGKPPYQNFTITIPSTLPTGIPAELSVFHVSLVGASSEPLTETRAIILNVD